jgi:trk system potassium uptake protein TrkA
VRVIVVGAGEVGRSIAANLADSHEVVVVERDPEIVEELTYAVDVLSLTGDGTSLETLREAGVEDADILIASTDDDETNLVACGTAKTVSEAFTIARVKKTNLLDTWRMSRGAFGVDFMVGSDLLTAKAIVQIAGLPGAHDADVFAGGSVRMAEFEFSIESPIAGQTVREADRFDSLTFAAIFREQSVTIPSGDTKIREGDRLVVIGSSSSVQQFATQLSPTVARNGSEEIVIVGGSEIGYQAARLFENHGLKPRLIEQDPDRARELAEELPKTVVMESDATDTEFLAREHVGEADLLISTLENDQKNLLVSLLADRQGVDRTVSIVESPAYVELFEAVGVDIAINPREETAEEITRFTREGQAENVAMLESDLAEVVEFEVDADSVLVGRSISEAVRDLPDSVVVGAITRNGELITPRGDTVVEDGDHVVVFLATDVLDDVVEKL